MNRVGDWIQTFTGRQFWPLDPRPEEVDISDIAHALSMLCRFAGHCNVFYSVAEHCVRVSNVCDPKDALWGLLHDASEAYVVDLPRPIKHQPELKEYRIIEQLVQLTICERFGLSIIEPESVKRADNTLLHTEARDLMSPLHPRWMDQGKGLPEVIIPWSPQEAKTNFLARYQYVTQNLLSLRLVESYGAAIRCFECEQLGHGAADCPELHPA